MLFDNQELFITHLSKTPENRNKNYSPTELFNSFNVTKNQIKSFDLTFFTKNNITFEYRGDQQVFNIKSLSDETISINFKLSVLRIFYVDNFDDLLQVLKGLKSLLAYGLLNETLNVNEAIKIFGKAIEFLNYKGGCHISANSLLKHQLLFLNLSIILTSFPTNNPSTISSPSILNWDNFEGMNYNKIFQAWTELYSINARHLKSNQELGLTARYKNNNLDKLSYIATNSFGTANILTGSVGGGVLREASWLVAIISNIEFYRNALGKNGRDTYYFGDLFEGDGLDLNSIFPEVPPSLKMELEKLKEMYKNVPTTNKKPFFRDVPVFRWTQNEKTTQLMAIPSNLLMTGMASIAQHWQERRPVEGARYPFTKVGIVGSNPQNVSVLYQELFNQGVPRFKAYFRVKGPTSTILRQFVTIEKWFLELKIETDLYASNQTDLLNYQNLSNTWIPNRLKEKANESKMSAIAKKIDLIFTDVQQKFSHHRDELHEYACGALQKIAILEPLSVDDLTDLKSIVDIKLRTLGFSQLSEDQLKIVHSYFIKKYIEERK